MTVRACLIQRPSWFFVLLMLLATAGTGCGRRDDVIASEARSQLAASAALHDASVSVIVKKGVVLLRGEVVNADQPHQATAIVNRIEGVRTIVDNLTLTDDGICDSVERALRADPVTSSVGLQVTVADGVVRLTSAATNAEQRGRAVELAGAVRGVTHVEDRMK